MYYNNTVVLLLRDHLQVLGNGDQRDVVFHQGDSMM